MSVRLVLLGAPGTGKGTQGRRLRQRYGVPTVSTGEMLREAVREGTPLGRRAKERMEQGLLIPDEVVIGLVEERLERPDTGPGFVLDGFPRTVPQAESLDRLLERRGTPLDAVLYFEAPVDVVVKRLSTRLECPTCRRAYNPVGMPPLVDRTCDDDGTELVSRADDDVVKVQKRVEVFFAETEVLRGFYERTGRLRAVDANRSPDEVFADLERLIGGGADTVPAERREGSEA